MKIFNTIISLCVFVWLVLNIFVLKAAYDIGTFWPTLVWVTSCIGIGTGITLLVFNREWEKQNAMFWDLSKVTFEITAERDEWKKKYGQYGPPTG